MSTKEELSLSKTNETETPESKLKREYEQEDKEWESVSIGKAVFSKGRKKWMVRLAPNDDKNEYSIRIRRLDGGASHFPAFSGRLYVGYEPTLFSLTADRKDWDNNNTAQVWKPYVIPGLSKLDKRGCSIIVFPSWKLANGKLFSKKLI